MGVNLEGKTVLFINSIIDVIASRIMACILDYLFFLNINFCRKDHSILIKFDFHKHIVSLDLEIFTMLLKSYYY